VASGFALKFDRSGARSLVEFSAASFVAIRVSARVLAAKPGVAADKRSSVRRVTLSLPPTRSRLPIRAFAAEHKRQAVESTVNSCKAVDCLEFALRSACRLSHGDETMPSGLMHS